MMNTSGQPLAQFQTLLEKHRANQLAYKEKIKDINLTRGKISDQLEILQLTYDKKLKSLEQKLQALKTQNEELIRDNVLCKSEIQAYQSRLLEKEKIIAVLLSQRKELPLAGSSERSKSQKTDSLNANEEQSKSFKKQGIIFKQDNEHLAVEKLKQQAHSQRQKQQIQINGSPKLQKILEKPSSAELKKPSRRTTPSHPIIPPHGVKTYQHLLPISDHQVINQVEENQQIHTKALPSHPPPPPNHKAKPRRTPPFQVHKLESGASQIEEKSLLTNIGQLGKQKKDLIEVHPHEQVQNIRQNDKDLESQSANINIDQEVQHADRDEQHIRAEQQVKINQYYQEVAKKQAEHQFQSGFQRASARSVPQQLLEQPQQPQNDFQPEQENNFLTHFNNNNNYIQTFLEPYQPRAKAKTNKRKVHRVQSVIELEQQVTGNDFFSQLSKGQNEVHDHLDIQESSIDHVDKDNSLFSNEQAYFIQEVEPVKRPVKMVKKKGKREQIKMMDSSCFD